MEPIAVKACIWRTGVPFSAKEAFHGDDVRRFTIDSSAKFSDMISEVTRRFSLADRKVTLKFKDDEGELCTLTSDEELQEAVRIAASCKPPILRVQITVQVEAEELRKEQNETTGPAQEPRWAPQLISPGQAMLHAWSHFGPAAWGYKSYHHDAEEHEFLSGKGKGRGGMKGKGQGKGCQPPADAEEEEEMTTGVHRGGKCGGRGGGKFGKGFWGRGFGKPRGFGKGMQFEAPHSARFVADVTVQDGATVIPGTEFTKTWRLRNDGSLPWPETAGLVFVKGDILHQEPVVAVGAVEPGQEVEVSVVLTAPPVSGRFICYWRLSAHAEAERERCQPWLQTPFGQRVWAQIVVTNDGKCELTGEEDSMAGNIRSAVRSLPDPRALPEYLAHGVASTIEKLDESTGISTTVASSGAAVSEQMSKLPDPRALPEYLVHGVTSTIEKLDESTGISTTVASSGAAVSERISKCTRKIDETITGALSLSPKLDVQDAEPTPDEPAVEPAKADEELEQLRAQVDALEARVASAGPRAEQFELVAPMEPEPPTDMSESLMADIASVNELEVAQLKEMGFGDEAAIRAALEKSDGSVIAAVGLLS